MYELFDGLSTRAARTVLCGVYIVLSGTWIFLFLLTMNAANVVAAYLVGGIAIATMAMAFVGLPLFTIELLRHRKNTDDYTKPGMYMEFYDLTRRDRRLNLRWTIAYLNASRFPGEFFFNDKKGCLVYYSPVRVNPDEVIEVAKSRFKSPEWAFRYVWREPAKG